MRTAAVMQLSVSCGGSALARPPGDTSSLRGWGYWSVLPNWAGPAKAPAQSSHTFRLELSQNPVLATSCDPQEAWEAHPCSFPVQDSGAWSFAGA